jgi:hypothetical protein
MGEICRNSNKYENEDANETTTTATTTPANAYARTLIS